MSLEPEQHHIICHALCAGKDFVYRNHYAACPGTLDAKTCEALVDMGLMYRGALTCNGELQFYYVTREGARAVGRRLSDADL